MEPHFCDKLAKNAEPECNPKEASDKPKLGHNIQNMWPLLFKTAKNIKQKSLQNCHSQEGPRDTGQLHVRWYLGCDPDTDKEQ